MKEPATIVAYKKIKSMILNQELLPGNQIVEGEFSKKFNMSRTPIRSAIRLLADDGLVEMKLNKGTFVKTFTKKDIILSFELVEALEGMATFLLTEKFKNDDISIEDINKLGRLSISMEEALKNSEYGEWAQLDYIFHTEITSMCGNYYIKSEYEKLQTQLNCVLWFITPFHVNKEVSNLEHREIIEAILRKEPNQSRQIAQKHRNRVRNSMVMLLK